MKIALNEYVPECRYFTWGEVLLLPQWRIHCYPEEKILWQLQKITEKVDRIRRELGRSIQITSGYRPLVYNKLIGGAQSSAHIEGRALDFQVPGMSAADVRAYLLPTLGDRDLRMENHDGDWVHIDHREPGPGGRYFRP